MISVYDVFPMAEHTLEAMAMVSVCNLAHPSWWRVEHWEASRKLWHWDVGSAADVRLRSMFHIREGAMVIMSRPWAGAMIR